MPAETGARPCARGERLLVQKVGGPSVYPYQPRRHLGRASRLHRIRQPTAVPADDHHRRSLYTFIKRNAPTRRCSVRFPGSRTRRAPADLEHAAAGARAARRPAVRRGLSGAGDACAEDASDAVDAQLTTVFRLATRRRPRAEELRAPAELLRAEVQRYTRTARRQRRLVAHRSDAGRRDVSIACQLAALTNVAAVVMNSPDAYSLR